jgi:ribokinase
MPPSIVVVGSSNTDMVVKSDRLPGPGETVTGGCFAMVPGGKGANQAVAAARLGAEVTFVAKVGDDVFGRQAIEGYRRDGIRTDFILRDLEQATGVALILVDSSGENLISVASGANHALTPGDVDAAAEPIRAADLVMLQLEIPPETVARAAAIAHQAGVPVMLDPAPAPDGPLDATLLSQITYLTPNETEAARLAGVDVADERSAWDAAQHLLLGGARHVIITLGAKGAFIAGPQITTLVPAPKVEAVDSTAAGDALNGGLAVALAGGAPIDEAVQRANLVAALSVTRLGAQTSLPTADELRQFGCFAPTP